MWLDRGRRAAQARYLPVVDHDFLDSFALDVDGKAERYRRLLHNLPPGLSEWAVHPGLGDVMSRQIDDGWRVRRTDLDFLISSAAREAVRREGIVIIDYSTIREVWLRQWASCVQG